MGVTPLTRDKYIRTSLECCNGVLIVQN